MRGQSDSKPELLDAAALCQELISEGSVEAFPKGERQGPGLEDGPDPQLSPGDHELVESRRAWREGDFADDYRRFRPMLERSIAWLVANEHRPVRFRGVERKQLGLSMRIAAVKLRRMVKLGLDQTGDGSSGPDGALREPSAKAPGEGSWKPPPHRSCRQRRRSRHLRE
jgi:hypothetical protein